MSTPFIRPISRLSPFRAVIKERYPLTKSGSTKETHHVVLDLKGSGMQFKVGDSIAIYGHNDPMLVRRILDTLKLSPDAEVFHPRTGEMMSLQNFLSTKVNIVRLTSGMLKLFNVESYPSQDTVDFFHEYGSRSFALSELVKTFSPLLPRFYSVASSLIAHPEEVHLTVAVSSYYHREELRYGVASHFLCHLADVGSTPIDCYVQPTPHFTLPQDHTTALIMVGPGTGIAPFRGFLQERIAHQAEGEHWLFFGERHRASDFFYEEFFSTLVSQNKLKLDLAFSRDQADKIYVQHKLLEQGAQLWSWLESGAFFYVCGDADPMAKDVEAVLHQICQEFGGLTIDAAKSYVKQLRAQKRYLTDVY